MEKAIEASGVPYTIARPTFITGPDREERRAGERTAAGLLDGALAVLAACGAKGLRERYRSINARELGVSLVDLALDPRATDKIISAEGLRGPR